MPVVTGTDHASRVAAAMAESSTRKRDSNGLTSTLPRSKLPKGNLPHSKNVLDTAGGLLVPPQLSGRSVVIFKSPFNFFSFFFISFFCVVLWSQTLVYGTIKLLEM